MVKKTAGRKVRFLNEVHNAPNSPRDESKELFKDCTLLSKFGTLVKEELVGVAGLLLLQEEKQQERSRIFKTEPYLLVKRGLPF